jgi:ABC-type transport system involved in multi-copper enzyme maturation permease subunit
VITPFIAIALNGFRESRRNRVSVVVALFAGGLLLCSTLITDVAVYTFERVLTDVGLGAMTIALVLLTIFLSSSQLSREIERKTLFLVVTKPVSRSTFLLGRFAGNLLTLAALLVAMTAVFLIQVRLFGNPITAAQLMATAMLLVELMVISSVGFLMSSFAGQTVSGIVTTGLFFAGHLSQDLYELSSRAKIPALQLLGKVAYYLLPNLDRLNYRPMAAYNLLPPAFETVRAVAYGVAYAAVMLGVAVIIFNRRDFK